MSTPYLLRIIKGLTSAPTARKGHFTPRLLRQRLHTSFLYLWKVRNQRKEINQVFKSGLFGDILVVQGRLFIKFSWLQLWMYDPHLSEALRDVYESPRYRLAIAVLGDLSANSREGLSWQKSFTKLVADVPNYRLRPLWKKYRLSGDPETFKSLAEDSRPFKDILEVMKSIDG